MQFNFGDSYLNLHGTLARVIVQSTSAVHISIKQFVHESSASSETPRMHSPSQLECNVLVYEALLRRRVEKKIAGDKNRRISKKSTSELCRAARKFIRDSIIKIRPLGYRVSSRYHRNFSEPSRHHPESEIQPERFLKTSLIESNYSPPRSA
ncbi:hypothetical protein HN011_002911 [Eciton burchellii]|nr:hypothetical protein HN011_002911 [Eciton burchellii]